MENVLAEDRPIGLQMCPNCRARCLRVFGSAYTILTTGRQPARIATVYECLSCLRYLRDPFMSEGMRVRAKGTRAIVKEALRPADVVAMEILKKFPHLPPLAELAQEVAGDGMLRGGKRAQRYRNRMASGFIRTPLWKMLSEAVSSPEARARLMRLCMHLREIEEAMAKACLQNPFLPVSPTDWRRGAARIYQIRSHTRQNPAWAILQDHEIVLSRQRRRVWRAALLSQMALRKAPFPSYEEFVEWVCHQAVHAPSPELEGHELDQAFDVWRAAGLDILKEKT